MKKLLFLSIWCLGALGAKLPCGPYFPVLSFEEVVHSPEGEPIADVLFLPGFSDQPGNHGPTFKALTDVGARVISFSYPGHGNTHARLGLDTLSLNFFTVARLASVAWSVERANRENPNRPLIVIGWSTGGNVALAMNAIDADRKIAGIFLIAPGIGVKTLPGEYGFSTMRSLTSNRAPQGVAPPKPSTPFAAPLFALALKTSTFFTPDLPDNTPTFLLLANDANEHYVDNAAAIAWGNRQLGLGHPLWGTAYRPEIFHGLAAKHAIEWEVDKIAADARELIVSFTTGVAEGTIGDSFEAPHLYLEPVSRPLTPEREKEIDERVENYEFPQTP